MPEIELVDVSKSFGRIKAIDHLNLKVRDREYFTLIGPTGHGKTTTLKLIAGLLSPDEGEIYIDGRRVTDLPPEERGLGFVFETFSLFPHFDVWRNTIYGPRVRGEDPETTDRVARRLLEMVLLEERTEAYPAELSGGMKQRVALARALATGSKLLLLDEPFGSLDAKIRMALRTEVRMMVEQLGLTALHVTNETEEAMTISDRMGILKRGHIIQVDTPKRIYQKPRTLFAAYFLGESNFFEGYVRDSNETSILVETRGGERFRATSPTDHERGERVVLVVRAENMNIVKKGEGGTNTVEGRVDRSQFVHGFTRYEIESDLDKNIVTWTYTPKGRGRKIGSRVTLRFEPGRALVFPYPEEGLEETLSFE